jgi:prepilin-type N-terminal cleavage/methylation domain-containing protein
MGEISARIERLRTEQRGFTLVEMLIVVALLSLVVAAAVSQLVTAYRIVPQDIEWATQVRETQTGLYRMTRELRQAQPGTVVISVAGPSSGNAIRADVVLKNTTYHLLFECDTGNQCRRKATTGATAPTAGPTGGKIIIKNLQNTTLSPTVPVFTTGSPAKFYQVQVKVKSVGAKTKGSATNRFHTVTLTDGFYGRNL